MNGVKKILVIEDDREIVESIRLIIRMLWAEVEFISTHSGERGLDLIESENPDVVILDIGLPDISGFEVLKQLRLFSKVPVLILTARSEEFDIVMGLESGADDYIVKPFRHLELMSRLNRLTRMGTSVKHPPLVYGQLSLDPYNKSASYGEKHIDLTNTELRILHELMQNVGEVTDHYSLAQSVFREADMDFAGNLRVHIRNLRKKIEANPSRPQIILTKTGVGYMLAKPD